MRCVLCLWCLAVLALVCVTYSRPPDDKHPAQPTDSRREAHHGKKKQETCFYETCDLGKPGMLNVHLVAHAHNDLGYRKTVDQYYWGALDYIIQPGAVQYILDTVVMALDKVPQRKFIFVEVGFLIRWWRQQDNETQQLFTDMVHDGRMELVMGGWGSNDEGTNHYAGMIDQMAIGLKFLKETFGEKCGVPKLAWQIDQFGQSREQTSLFAMMGFDGLFFGRISHQDKSTRMADKTLEMMWYGSANLGDQSSLFTGILYNRYEPPWQIWPLEPIKDDPLMPDYNVDIRVLQFLRTAEDWAQYYTTNHIMMLLGADFEFSNAHRNYKNMDKLIKYVNQEQQNGSQVNAIMSTPTCYMYALNQANQTYKPKFDDFMPLESEVGSIWNGYFTSRPTLKRYERTSNGLLQACKQLDVLAELGQGEQVFKLAEEVAIMQHHDALTGTCKQPVAYDYALRLHKGNVACQQVADSAYQKLLPLDGSITAEPPRWRFCDLRNVSFCDVTENNQAFMVMVYNPMGVPVQSWVRVPVTGSAYTVSDPALLVVGSQVVPLSPETLDIPDREGSISTAELVFRASVPAVGYSTYFIQQQLPEPKEKATKEDTKYTKISGNVQEDTQIENEFLRLTFDESSGLLKSLTLLEKDLTVAVNQSLQYYPAVDGEPKSTVYYFFPNTSSFPVESGKVETTLIQGGQVQEFRQVFSNWTSQVFRLYQGQRQAEVEWTVGPIPVADEIGKEIVSVFQTDLDTNELYYTDSNGREMMQRRRNFQPTWNLNVSNPVSVNYYPINTRIYIRDEAKDAQLTLMTDRSHGGGSIYDGQMEVMIQRRFTAPDTGVDEVFDEPGITGNGIVVRGRMFIQLDTISDSAQYHRDLSQKMFSEPILSFSEQTLPPQEYVTNFRTQWSAINTALPPNVHLLTLEALYENQILLRLEHFYENNEDPTLSQDATVALQDLFIGFDVIDLEELTLGANQPLASVSRLQWNVEGFGRTAADITQFVTPVDPVALEVVLKPMQIRTFLLNVQYRPIAAR